MTDAAEPPARLATRRVIDAVPLGHVAAAHLAFEWCESCAGRDAAEELEAWRVLFGRLVDAPPETLAPPRPWPHEWPP